MPSSDSVNWLVKISKQAEARGDGLAFKGLKRYFATGRGRDVQGIAPDTFVTLLSRTRHVDIVSERGDVTVFVNRETGGTATVRNTGRLFNREYMAQAFTALERPRRV